MPVTIRSLLNHWNGSTRLVVGGTEGPSIDEPLRWVHSSELADPTPFLDAGHLLLTDGTQFQKQPHDRNIYDSYVARLSEHGIAGLGFGTSLIHSELPAELEEACRRHGLPLFLITDLTPFLAFSRFVADELAREQTARIRWSLDAQRAIARAAMRPDGLTSILAELEKQLNCSALLFDAVGTCIRAPTDGANIQQDNMFRDAVRSALERGTRSASHVMIGRREFMLQTIGHGKRLDGVLALGGLDWPDPAATDLVNSVIALAGLALTQTRALDKAHHHLRAGLFEQLLRGDRELATRTATSVWGGLPRAPLTVIVTPQPDSSDFLLDALEREAAEHRGRVFFTQREDRIVVLAEATPPDELLQLLTQHGIPIGASTATSVDTLPRGVAEAERALRHAVETGQPNVTFQEFLDRGVLGLLRREHAGTVARGILRVLHEHDAEKGSDLLTTARVWVNNECAWDTTARELGIHRHTLRNRIQLAGRLLNLDLDVLRDRLELWVAVQLMTED
ncbi:PucR family transcriptional regulator [Mycolicibacterium houstonense]|uniref:PucR family transcriptional regulator n=1 Tax=Mycolicibacterium houstonense TaxID=146021 RepID=UPI003F953998